MIAEALHTGVLFYLSGLLSLLGDLAIVNLKQYGYESASASSDRR